MLAALQKWAGAGGFISIAVVLFFWTFFENFGISHERLLSIAMALFAGLIIYFDDRLSKVLTREKPITKMTIAQAINRIFHSTTRIRHLRISALTGEMITPLFSGHEIKIVNAELLLREFNLPLSKTKEMAHRVEWAVSEWKEMQREGKVVQLEVAKYHGEPNCFVVIFDALYMVIGSYYPDPKTTTGVETGSSFLIDGSTEGGALMIEAWASTFDNQFSYWKAQVH